MTYLFAKFLVLFDPIIDWIDRGEDEARKYFSLFVLWVIACAVSVGMAFIFGMPAINLGTVLSMIAAVIFGIVAFVTFIVWMCEFSTSQLFEDMWEKTGEAFIDKVNANKRAIREQKANTVAPVTNTTPVTPKEDIQYLG